MNIKKKEKETLKITKNQKNCRRKGGKGSYQCYKKRKYMTVTKNGLMKMRLKKIEGEKMKKSIATKEIKKIRIEK